MNNRTKAAQQALEQITQLIEEQGGIVKKEQFTELGIDYRRILDFVQSGDLVRIKNGYYTDRVYRGGTGCQAFWRHQTLYGECTLCVWLHFTETVRLASGGRQEYVEVPF